MEAEVVALLDMVVDVGSVEVGLVAILALLPPLLLPLLLLSDSLLPPLPALLLSVSLLPPLLMLLLLLLLLLSASLVPPLLMLLLPLSRGPLLRSLPCCSPETSIKKDAYNTTRTRCNFIVGEVARSRKAL